MTVRELIEKLEELPLYSELLISDGDDGYMPYVGEPGVYGLPDMQKVTL